MKNAVRQNLIFYISLIIVLAVAVHWCGRKRGMFLDELYSYGLSNSTEAPFINELNGNGVTESVVPGSTWRSYLAVDDGEQFDYASVYYNQMQDVHPPLYYFALHTVCSFFPERFSKWFGLGLNLIILTLTLIVLYRLSVTTLKDRTLSALVCLVYGTSRAGLSTALMIRMYMMLTFFTVLLTYIVMRNIQKPFRGFYAAVFAAVYAGMMTQYFFAVYTFFFCAAYDIGLLVKRKFRQFFGFSAAAVLGVAAMLLTFPAVFMQSGSQQKVSIGTVAGNASSGLHFAVTRTGYLLRELIRYTPAAAVLAAASLALLAILFFSGGKKKIQNIGMPVMLIGIPLLVSFVVIAVISPYQRLRYVYHLIPLFVLTAGLFGRAVSGAFSSGKWKYISFAAFAALSCFFVLRKSPDYLYSGHGKTDHILRENASAECVYITANKNPSVTSDLMHLILMDDTCVTESAQSDILDQYVEKKKSDTMVVFIATYPEDQDDEAILGSLKSEYGFASEEKIASEGFSNIYLLEKAG